MKKTLLFVTTLLAATSFSWAEAQVGKAAPGFTIKDVNGRTHQLSDYQGKVVVLEAYNLDCPYVANH
jgi:hypothetical protein